MLAPERLEGTELTERQPRRHSFAVKARRRRLDIGVTGDDLRALTQRAGKENFTLSLVVADPSGNRKAELPIALKRQESRRGKVRSTGSDLSGALQVLVELNLRTLDLNLQLSIGDLVGLSVKDIAPTVRLLRELRKPMLFGLAIPGKRVRNEQLVEVQSSESLIESELALLLESLCRVSDAVGVKDMRVPDRVTAAEQDSIIKADRLLSGDIVHHTWKDMTVVAPVEEAQELLDGPLSGQASLDIRMPFEVWIGDRTLTLDDRWLRVRSAVVSNAQEARHGDSKTRKRELHLVPGYSDQALSKIGEFPPHGAEGPHGGRQADALRPYIGKWVGTRNLDVIAHAGTLEGLLSKLQSEGLHADAVVKVPERGDVDVAGLR